MIRTCRQTQDRINAISFIDFDIQSLLAMDGQPNRERQCENAKKATHNPRSISKQNKSRVHDELST